MSRLGRLFLVIGMFAMSSSAAAQSISAFAATLDAQWDFDKPEISEQRFRAELSKWPPDSAQAQEVSTQIARTQGLRRKSGG